MAIDPNELILKMLSGNVSESNTPLSLMTADENEAFNPNKIIRDGPAELRWLKESPSRVVTEGLFGVPKAELMRMAGEVVPLPPPAFPETAGKPLLQELAQGQREIRAGNPQISQHPMRDVWADRLWHRARAGSGGPKGTLPPIY